MQDITEQQELAQEISDAISKPVGFGEEFDEVGDVLWGHLGFVALEQMTFLEHRIYWGNEYRCWNSGGVILLHI